MEEARQDQPTPSDEQLAYIRGRGVVEVAIGDKNEEARLGPWPTTHAHITSTRENSPEGKHRVVGGTDRNGAIPAHNWNLRYVCLGMLHFEATHFPTAHLLYTWLDVNATAKQ